MKRLVLSLCLVGAVFPGHTRLAFQKAQGPPTSAEQRVEAGAVLPLPGTAMLKSLPQPPNSGVERTAVQSSAMVGEDTEAIRPPEGDNHRAALPTPGESVAPPGSPFPEIENQEANWVVVIRGATLHSGPSVSAPIVRFYSVGTELELIEHHRWPI